MKKFMSLTIAALLLFTGITACAGPEKEPEGVAYDERNLSAQEYALMNLVGRDALGREIFRSDGRKTDKTRYVGLFYSVWLGQHRSQQTGIYNVTELLSTPEGTEALLDPKGSAASPTGEFHFWGEPLYGYYSMQDPWVVTRHVELLTMAGIDYLCFDATNAKVYKDSTDNVLDTLLKFQRQGFDVPKIVFYTNSSSGDTVDIVYNNYYQTEKYASLWFEPNGKPLIIGITENNNKASDQTKYYPYDNFVSSEMQEFFDVRESEWPNGDFHENSIPWMSWEYPQNIHSGSVAVPVAQHSHSRISASFQDPECSRGYDNGTGEVDADFRAGKSFQTMWDSVFERDALIDNVLVTSFNEWMAIKQGGKEVQFVDVYNEEYSRDIEMMKGGYGDNFYLQMVQNVRKYKFSEAVNYRMKRTSIDIFDDDDLVLWDYVTAKYRDFEGDAMERNFVNASGTARYTDRSNRNDITEIRAAHDGENLYFYVETAQDVTPYNGTDLNWMNLFLRTGESGDNFAGYQYVINRSPGEGTTTVERSKGGYDWERVGEAGLRVNGRVMQLAIPLSALGLTADNCVVEFKVSDNVTRYDDIMDYYVTGDSAPLGRLSYSYGC